MLKALDGRTHMDDIILRSGLPAQTVMSALTMLEISGLVAQEPGKMFVPTFRFTNQAR